MIPASYMFRNAYARAWEFSDDPAVPQQHRSPLRGLLSPLQQPLASLVKGLLEHRRIGHGQHAYE